MYECARDILIRTGPDSSGGCTLIVANANEFLTPRREHRVDANSRNYGDPVLPTHLNTFQSFAYVKRLVITNPTASGRSRPNTQLLSRSDEAWKAFALAIEADRAATADTEILPHLESIVSAPTAAVPFSRTKYDALVNRLTHHPRAAQHHLSLTWLRIANSIKGHFCQYQADTTESVLEDHVDCPDATYNVHLTDWNRIEWDIPLSGSEEALQPSPTDGDSVIGFTSHPGEAPKEIYGVRTGKQTWYWHQNYEEEDTGLCRTPQDLENAMVMYAKRLGAGEQMPEEQTHYVRRPNNDTAEAWLTSLNQKLTNQMRSNGWVNTDDQGNKAVSVR